MTSIVVFGFRVPLRGSFVLLLLLLLTQLSLLNTLGLGSLVPTIVRTQQQAMMTTWFTLNEAVATAEGDECGFSAFDGRERGTPGMTSPGDVTASRTVSAWATLAATAVSWVMLSVVHAPLLAAPAEDEQAIRVESDQHANAMGGLDPWRFSELMRERSGLDRSRAFENSAEGAIPKKTGAPKSASLFSIGVEYGAPLKLGGSLRHDLVLVNQKPDLSPMFLVQSVGSLGIGGASLGAGPGIVSGANVFSVRATLARTFGDPRSFAPNQTWMGVEGEWSAFHFLCIRFGSLCPTRGRRKATITWSVGIGLPLVDWRKVYLGA